MQEHPLNYFKEFFDNPNKLSDLKKAFLAKWEDFSFETNYKEVYVITEVEDQKIKIDFESEFKQEVESKKQYSLKGIDEIVLTFEEHKKQKYFLETIIVTINGLLLLLKEREELSIYDFFEESLLEVKRLIQVKYNLDSPNISSIKETFIKPNHKIQWLGKTNLLTTLIYDLWQGQDKGSKLPSSKPLIKATKSDLEQLLLNNFLDEKGKPLKPSVISDYLNTAKPETRTKKGNRVEL